MLCVPLRRLRTSCPGQMSGSWSFSFGCKNGGRSFSSCLKASTVRLLFSSVWKPLINSSSSKMLVLILLLLIVFMYMVLCIFLCFATYFALPLLCCLAVLFSALYALWFSALLFAGCFDFVSAACNMLLFGLREVLIECQTSRLTLQR